MMRWQNCLTFETPLAFMDNVQNRGNYWYYSSFTIQKPNTFPAFFYLETDCYEPYWKPCSKDFVLSRWETALQGYVNMVEELKNGY